MGLTCPFPAVIIRAVKTLREIIDELGPTEVAKHLGVSQGYVSRMKLGQKPISAAVLARAVGYYRELDIDGTLREFRSSDVEYGERVSQATTEA